MRSIAEAVSELAGLVPLGKAASWDPVGLQFGDPDAECRVVGVCHEVDESVVAAIVEHPVDLIVAYHPLLFRPTARLVAGTSAAGRAFRLIRAGVALAVVHTAFDVASGGAADTLAAALGVVDPKPFAPSWAGDYDKVVTFVPGDAADDVAAAMAAAGGGRVGAYSACSFRSEGVGTFVPEVGAAPVVGTIGELSRQPETRIEMPVERSRVDSVVAALVAAHPYEEPAYDVVGAKGNAGFLGRVGELDTAVDLEAFARRVESALGTSPRVSPGRRKTAVRVAVIPGSGRSFAAAAAAAGADAMVTGDMGHHDTIAANDLGLAVLDPGHVATERPGLASLYAAASNLGETVDFTGLAAAPWEDR